MGRCQTAVMKTLRVVTLLALVAVGAYCVSRSDYLPSHLWHTTDTRFSPAQQNARIRSLRKVHWQEVEGKARVQEQGGKLDDLLARNVRVLIVVESDGCIPCLNAARFLRTLSPRFPAVFVLYANMSSPEWVSIGYVLKERGWMAVDAVPYFVTVKNGSLAGTCVGFNSEKCSTEALLPDSSQPEGISISLATVVAALADGGIPPNTARAPAARPGT